MHLESSTSTLLQPIDTHQQCTSQLAMPKKNKRQQQLALLAEAKRSRSRCQGPSIAPQPQPQPERCAWTELKERARTTPWCCPSLQLPRHDTSSEEDSSEYGDGPATFTVESIYAKKTDSSGNVYYFVSWVGYPDSTWQPAVDLPQQLINEFEREELGVVWPVDLRAWVPIGTPTGTRGRGRRGRR
jgi:hypothetical protein